MKQVIYVGMDVHKNFIVAVYGVVRGKPLMIKVGNNPKGWDRLKKLLEEFEVRAVYEASSCGFEVYDEMSERGWSVTVVAPSHLVKSAKDRKTKTDLRDALDLWSRLVAWKELGTPLPAVWIPPVEVRQDRELVRRRLALGEHLSQSKASILSLLQIHKVRHPEEFKGKWTKKHVAWVRGLCGENSAIAQTVKSALKSMLRELDFLLQEQHLMQEEVEALAREERYQAKVEALIQVPGVAELTAMTFLTELGDVNRFDNRKQLGSYLGVTPTSHESGESNDRKGHITRMGPWRIRKVLNQAVWCGVRLRPEVGKRFTALAMRRGNKKAIVAEMRRLGIELWHRACNVA